MISCRPGAIRRRTATVCAVARPLGLSMARTFWWFALTSVAGAQIVDNVANEQDAPVPRFALLVGVQDYPNLSSGEQLEGCANDVVAVKALLLERFGFETNHVTCLVNEQATGDAIRVELKNLIGRVRALPADSPPAQVVFHFSGHGSQVKDQEEGRPDCDEADGLDETLVPYNATRQGGEEDVRDDELYEFAERLCADERARLWMVLDCCHSGTGARGATKVRKLHRGITPNPPADNQSRRVLSKRLPDGAVVLSACRAREVEPEYRQEDKSYGLLTRFLVQVLNEEENVSSLSYDLLRESIVARYRQDPAVTLAPVPQLEGDADSLRGAICGGRGFDRKPVWEARPYGADRGVALIRAGAFHGLTADSLYQVYLRPDQIEWQPVPPSEAGDDPSLFWLRVEQVQGATARGRVFRWENDEQIESTLPLSFKQGYAVERFHQHGGFGVRLQVVVAGADGSDGPALPPTAEDVPPVIRKAITTVHREDESPWLHWLGPDQSADLLLRIDGHFAALFPSTGLAHLPPQKVATRGDMPKSLVGGWGPIDLRKESETVDQLKDYLRRITRARNLLRLVATRDRLRSESPGSGASSVQVDLELIVVDQFEDDGYTVKKWRPWEPDSDGGLTMRDLQTYAYRVVNREAAGKPVYVSVLHVDSNMGIDQVLPFQHGAELIGEQVLQPGEARITDAFDCNADETEPPVYGRRWVVVLATREPNDFYMLQQSSLPRTRSEWKGTGGGLRSDATLSQLLMEQAYFRPQTRGDARRRRPVKLYDESWSSAYVQWTVLPSSR